MPKTIFRVVVYLVRAASAGESVDDGARTMLSLTLFASFFACRCWVLAVCVGILVTPATAHSHEGSNPFASFVRLACVPW